LVFALSGGCAGGGGNLAYSIGGPMYFSLLPFRKRAGRAELCVGVDRSVESAEELDNGGCDFKVDGLVPDLCRWLSCCDDANVAGVMVPCGLVRNCAADADGRSLLRGATDPTVTSELNISSSLMGGFTG